MNLFRIGLRKRNKIKRGITFVIAITLVIGILPLGVFTITVKAAGLTAVVDHSATGYSPTQIVNGTFETRPFMTFSYNGTTYSSYVNDNTPAYGVTISSGTPNGVGGGWNTTETQVYKGTLFEWTNDKGVYGLASNNGYFLEMNAHNPATLYQDLATHEGDVILWTLKHAARGSGKEYQAIEVEVGAPNGTPSGTNANIKSNTLAKYIYSGVTGTYGKANASELAALRRQATGNNSWYTAKGVYMIPEGQETTRFAFISTESSNLSYGNMLDDITFNTLLGNLKASIQEDESIVITGYWGETDSSKKLDIKIGSTVKQIDMSAVTGKNFKITIPASEIPSGNASLMYIYHQDYEAAAKKIHVHNWHYSKNAAGDTVTLSCSGSECPLAGTSALSISAEDVEFKDKYYSLDHITLSNTLATFNEISNTNINKSNVIFYVDEACTIKTNTDDNHGSAKTEGGAPRDLGTYYVQIVANVAPTTGVASTQSVKTSFSIVRDLANYELDTLNNVVTEDGSFYNIVNGNYTSVKADNSAEWTLRIHLKDAGDTVKIYKIATSYWDSHNAIYKKLAWDPTVAAWINSNEYSDENYQEPELLTNLSQSLQTALFATMFPTTGTGGLTLDEYTAVTPSAVTHDSTTDEYIISYDKIEFGLYAVVATSSANKKYSVSVKAVKPEQTGPLNSWIIKRFYDVYIKAADVTIDKKINDKKLDTVAYDDTVKFDIVFDIPDYKDRVVLPEGDSIKAYTYYFEDYYSDAFSVDAGSIEVYGIQSNATEVKLSSSTNYEYNAFADSSYTSGTTVGDNLTQVTYDQNPSDALKTAKYIVQSGKIYTVQSLSTATNPETNETANYLRINFNIGAIKAYNKSNANAKITKLRVTYKAKVTKDVLVNSESNYNTGVINIETNNTGTKTGSLSDTVKAYTYGLNVIKVDGEDSSKYLDGAKFWLYKEAETFVNSAFKGAMDATDLSSYYTENYSSLVTAYNASKTKDEDKLTVTGASDFTLDDMKKLKPEGTEYYYYTYVYDSTSNTTLDNGVELKKGDQVTRVFKRISFYDGTKKNNVFESVADSAGKTINGLDTGNYILIEAEAPTNYNELAEDILFSLKELTGDEINTKYAGSAKYCKHQDNTYNEEAIERLVVLNYKGLMLPSTGGSGTVLFLCAGMAIMMISMTLLIRRRKTIEY